MKKHSIYGRGGQNFHCKLRSTGKPDIRSGKEIEIRETKGIKVHKIYEFKILFLIQR